MTLESLVLALVLFVLGGLATWWWGNRRTTLFYEVTFIPLMTKVLRKQQGPDLTILWSDQQVQDPYLVEVRILNAGPSDVAPDKFASGRGGITLAGECAGSLSVDGWVVEPGEEGTTVLLGPTLLQDGEVREATFLFDGFPSEVVPIDRLENVRLRRNSNASYTTRSVVRRVHSATTVLLSLMFGYIIARVGDAVLEGRAEEWLASPVEPALYVATLLLLAIALLLLGVLVLEEIRGRRTRRLRRRSES